MIITIFRDRIINTTAELSLKYAYLRMERVSDRQMQQLEKMTGVCERFNNTML